MDKPKPIAVEALKTHTFRGKEYNQGDTYKVDGDEAQTSHQYVDTLRATGLARPVDEKGQGPNIVDEIGEPPAAAASPTAVEPLKTGDLTGESEAPTPKPATTTKVADAKKPASRKSAKSGGKKK